MKTLISITVFFNLLIFIAGCKSESEERKDAKESIVFIKEAETQKVLKTVLGYDKFQYLSKYASVIVVSESVDLKKDLSIKKDENIAEHFGKVSEFIEKKGSKINFV